MSKNKNYVIGGILVGILLVGSIFGIVCCGLHSFISLANQGGSLFGNLYEGLKGDYLFGIILLCAMIIISGVITAVYLTRKSLNQAVTTENKKQ